MPLCVNREYKCTRSLDLETLDLERSWWGTYTDAAAQAEFYRYVNRDIASTITGCIFGPGAMSYGLLNAVAIRPSGLQNYVGYIVNGCFVILTLVADLFLLWRKRALDTSASWWRSRFAIVYCVAICWAVAHPLTGFYVRCGDNTDYFGYIYDRPAFDAAMLERDCIDIVVVYVLVGYGLGMTVLNVTPLLTLLFAVALPINFYSGYAVASLMDHGESTRELVAKAVLYITFAVVVVTLKLVRYRTYQAQFETTLATDRERRRATRAADEVDGMLQAMVPGSALERLLAGEAVRDRVESASVLFSDMAGFTEWSSSRSAAEVVEMLNVVCTRLDAEAEARGVVKIKTIGDAYWAATGIPEELGEHAEVLCGFAQWMHGVVAEEVASHPHWGSVRLRVGVASGPVDGGIFGTSRLSYEVSGATCDLASLCEQRGVPLRVCVCSRTKALLELSVEDPDAHIEVEHPGGGTEQLWLLKEARGAGLLESSSLDLSQAASSVRSGQSQSTVASAMPMSQSAAAAQAAKRRFLAARAAMAQAQRSTTDEDGSSSHQLSPEASGALGGRRRGSIRVSQSSHHFTPSPSGAQQEMPGYVATSKSDFGDSSLNDQTDQLPHESTRAEKYTVDVGLDAIGDVDDEYPPIRVIPDEDHPPPPAGGLDDDAAARDIETRGGLGARRYSWVLMQFADSALEHAFGEFVARQHLTVRRTCNAALVALIAAIGIGVAIEGRASDAGGITTLVLCGAVACGSLAAAVAAVNPVIDAVLMHVCAALAVAGMWQLEWQSLFGRDTAYLHAVLTILLGFGISVWPSALVLLLNVIVLVVPITAQTRDSVWFGGNILFVLFSFFMLGFTFVGQEKHFRRQFIDLETAKQAIEAQAQRAKEQETLLLAIVPPHAVTPLTTWLSKGKDAAHTVNDKFSLLNIGFVRLVQPETHGPVDTAASWLFAAHTAVDEVLDTYGRWLDKVKTMGDTVMVAGPFRSTALPEEAAGDADTTTAGGEDAKGAVTTQEVQRRGGQQADASVRVSAMALLEAVRELRDAGGSFICGLHAGEVMGVVLGTSRLCYDIFGDAVNTASRTMTSLRGALQEEHAGGAYCAVSAEYRALVDAEVALQAGGGPLAGLRFSGARSAQAKGKASLDVHAVAYSPMASAAR